MQQNRGIIEELIGLFTERITIWPVPEHCEDEALKRHHAQEIVDRYMELLGIEKIVKIVKSASTEQVMEEMILNEIDLTEQMQQEHDLQFRDVLNAERHACDPATPHS